MSILSDVTKIPHATTFGGGRSTRETGPKVTNEVPGPGSYAAKNEFVKPASTAFGFKKEGNIESLKAQ